MASKVTSADCSDGQATMNAAKTCTAQFNIVPLSFVYSLSVTAEDLCNPNSQTAGKVTSDDGAINYGKAGTNCAKDYSSEVAVKLTAEPASGYVLWAGKIVDRAVARI